MQPLKNFVAVHLRQADGEKEANFKGARFYAVAGRADEATRQESLQAGFHGHFVKPLDFALLEKLLD